MNIASIKRLLLLVGMSFFWIYVKKRMNPLFNNPPIFNLSTLDNVSEIPLEYYRDDHVQDVISDGWKKLENMEIPQVLPLINPNDNLSKNEITDAYLSELLSTLHKLLSVIPTDPLQPFLPMKLEHTATNEAILNQITDILKNYQTNNQNQGNNNNNNFPTSSQNQNHYSIPPPPPSLLPPPPPPPPPSLPHPYNNNSPVTTTTTFTKSPILTPNTTSSSGGSTTTNTITTSTAATTNANDNNTRHTRDCRHHRINGNNECCYSSKNIKCSCYCGGDGDD